MTTICPHCDSLDVECANESEGIYICHSCDKWFYADESIIEPDFEDE